jgi:putative ABC transport system permease protein
VNWEVATPEYFQAMDIRLLQGRTFTDADHEKAPPVVVISQSLAARLWPGQDAVGRRLITWGAPGDEKNPGWQTVVGVVEDARYREVHAPRFDLYLPYRQAPNQVQHFMLRIQGDAVRAAPALRAAVAAIDRDVRLDNVEPMSEVVGRTFAPWRFSAVVLSGFSVTALAFAAVGIAALVAYAVMRRTREIAVRVALGAQRRDVFALILREGLALTAAGLAAGLLVAWLITRTVSSLLFDVAPGDAVTFTGVAFVLIAVAALAAYLPARRATRIDPATALRLE